MKVRDLLESADWENTSFDTRESELQHFNKKLKAIDAEGEIFKMRLKQFRDKAELFSDLPWNQVNDYQEIPLNLGDYKRYYIKKNTTPSDRLNRVINAANANFQQRKQVLERIKELTIKGHSFCFTGFRDKDMEAAIKAGGGHIASGVSKNLTFLVALDPNEQSGKLNKAREYGITILSKDHLKKILRV